MRKLTLTHIFLVSAATLILTLFPHLSPAQTLESPPAAPSKPIAAFFPLGGSTREYVRGRCGFAMRKKLERDGHYEVIDGPRMDDVAAEAKEPVSLNTSPEEIKELGKLVNATVMIWGEINGPDNNAVLKVKYIDLREKEPKVRELEKRIVQPTDVRFAAEEILAALPGVSEFEHFNTEAYQDDPEAAAMWAKNPNMMANGDFSKPGHWEGIYMAEKYPIKISATEPPLDKVAIYPMKDAETGKTSHVLFMNLSEECAGNNGLACLSDPMPIKPNTRYRISFRYKSEGPTQLVFVKGYTMQKDLQGKPKLQEIYRRQVPRSGGTDGQWKTVVVDLNPQHIVYPVQFLKVDLYAYWPKGKIMFADVVLKEVGKPTHKAEDEAIKKPVGWDEEKKAATQPLR